MPCASFSMLRGPGGTGCNVPVHSCWDSRDVIVAAVFDCVKECIYTETMWKGKYLSTDDTCL